MSLNVNGVCPGGNSDNDKVSECLLQQGAADDAAGDELSNLQMPSGDFNALVATNDQATDMINASGKGNNIAWIGADTKTLTAKATTVNFKVGTRVKITNRAALANDKFILVKIDNIGKISQTASTACGFSTVAGDATKHTVKLIATTGFWGIAAGDSIVLRCDAKLTDTTGTWIIESMSSTTEAVGDVDYS